MVGWHHQLNGHEFEQALGDSDGQGSLQAYRSPWSSKVGHDRNTSQQHQRQPQNKDLPRPAKKTCPFSELIFKINILFSYLFYLK